MTENNNQPWETPSNMGEIPPQNFQGFYFTQPPQPPQPPKKPKKHLGWIIALVAIYVLTAATLLVSIANGGLSFNDPAGGVAQTEEGKTETGEKEPNNPLNVTPVNPSDQNGNETQSPAGQTAAKIYEENVASVVFVHSKYANGYSTGSGFVVDAQNGYLLTNHHVVDDSSDVTVTFSNGTSYPAKIIAGDEINDVAVLKIEAENLKQVKIANSDQLKIGDDVLVIGNPLGDLTFTLTRGIVSGVNRTINTGEHNIKTFQTDAAINSGNSGGPAFDANGAVIGIASAKYASTGVEGIGFCIPINDAVEIAKDLVEHGYVTGRPNFGVTVSTSLGYTYELDQFGRRVRVETAYGAVIEEVGKSSCAAEAGLQVGDIVTKLNNTKIQTANELINEKNRYKAGETVTLEVYRDGKTLTLTVTLDEYTP